MVLIPVMVVKVFLEEVLEKIIYIVVDLKKTVSLIKINAINVDFVD
jgi:hypothetical protein